MNGHEPSLDRTRVVIIGLNYAPETTGIAPYTAGLARHLAAQGHDVTVICGHPHYPEWQLHPGYEQPRLPEHEHGVRLLRVPHPVPRDPRGGPRIWMEVVFAWRAAGQLLRHHPPVVVVISPALLALVPVLLLRRGLGYRVGVVVQDLYGAALSETALASPLVARLTTRLEMALLRSADGVAAIHDVFRRKLLANGVAQDDVVVIPNWTHVSVPEDFDRASTRRRLGWRDDEIVALHAGNMGVKQGLEGLIDVARLAEANQAPLRVVLLGDGSRKSALMEYGKGARRLSMLEPLPAEEFESAVAAADCLLLHEAPGVIEMSVPSKLTTYLGAGRPVVAATDPRSGAAAIMNAAGAGITVQPGDAAAVLTAVMDIANDPGKAQAMGHRASRYAAAHLSPSGSLAKAEAWVVRLAGRPTSRGFPTKERK